MSKRAVAASAVAGLSATISRSPPAVALSLTRPKMLASCRCATSATREVDSPSRMRYSRWSTNRAYTSGERTSTLSNVAARRRVRVSNASSGPILYQHLLTLTAEEQPVRIKLRVQPLMMAAVALGGRVVLERVVRCVQHGELVKAQQARRITALLTHCPSR